nr:MAG TPA: hypothetical protein [Caudoviricetes sp.]
MSVVRFPESYPHILVYSIIQHWGYLDTLQGG